jgi:hypothetical protein
MPARGLGAPSRPSSAKNAGFFPARRFAMPLDMAKPPSQGGNATGANMQKPK